MARQSRSAVYAAAYLSLKGHIGSLLGAGALFFSFTLVIAGLTLLTPLTLLITIPFLFAPGYFVFLLYTANSVSTAPRPIPFSELLRRYFSPGYYRVFRPFVGMAKAVGFGMAFMVPATVVYAIVSNAINPDFGVMMARFMDAYVNLYMNLLSSIIFEDPAFVHLAMFASFVFSAVALTELMIHFSRYSFNVYARRVVLTSDLLAINELFLKSYRLHKKDDVWPYVWPLDALSALWSVFSFFLVGFLAMRFSIPEMFAFPLALGLAFFLLSFLLPFWFCLAQVLSRRVMTHMVMDSYYSLLAYGKEAPPQHQEMIRAKMASFRSAVDPLEWAELAPEYETETE